MTPDFEQEKELENQYVMHTYGRKPVEFVEGHGMKLVDSEGKEYLDFLAGIAVLGVGHSHPKVVAAIQEQAGKLIHVSNYYYANGRGELAKKINDLMNVNIPEEQVFQTFFANSGAEANEGAIKLARRYADMVGKKDSKKIMYLNKSFHGRTLATLAATGQPAKQDIFRPLPDGFVAMERNDIDSFTSYVDSPDGADVCAVILEPIQGESGVWPCSAEFLQALREETQKRGILMILDEVQTGFFRCGTYPFCFQHAGIIPDIVTLAKSIASGIPMGAFVARKEVAQAMQPGDHGSTFGGNQLAITASLATIDAMIEENVGQNAEEVGTYLKAKLEGLPDVTEVRGMGLMLGVQFAHPIAVDVVMKGLDEGLVLNYTGEDTMRLLPPLICSKDDVDVLIEKLQEIIPQVLA